MFSKYVYLGPLRINVREHQRNNQGMDNSEQLATLGTEDEDTFKNTPPYTNKHK
jgi:hypothetical protein